MGMIFVGRRLSAEQSAGLADDPSAAWELLHDQEDVLDLDKAWLAIHFLLTGSVWEVPPGAGEAVLGGDPVGEDQGYGPPRLLPADRVRAVAAALQEVTPEALRARFDLDALLEAEVYPHVWDEDDIDTYVLPNFAHLREFYRAAAAQGDAVLLAIT